MGDRTTTQDGQPVMELEDWSRATKAGQDTAGLVVRHAEEVTIRSVDVASRSVEAVAGTSSVDRYRDRILVEGYDLVNYQRNPVVQWCHNYWEPPIATCAEMAVQGPAFVVRDIFVEADIYPFAGMIFDMIAHPLRFIRALSVGVRPRRSEYIQERGGYDITESEMLEHSWCPIGVNPEALVKAKSVGINVQPMDEWARRCLDGELGLYVPRDRAEAIVKVLGYGKGLALFELDPAAIAAVRSPSPAAAAEAAAEPDPEEPHEEGVVKKPIPKAQGEEETAAAPEQPAYDPEVVPDEDLVELDLDEPADDGEEVEIDEATLQAAITDAVTTSLHSLITEPLRAAAR